MCLSKKIESTKRGISKVMKNSKKIITIDTYGDNKNIIVEYKIKIDDYISNVAQANKCSGKCGQITLYVI